MKILPIINVPTNTNSGMQKAKAQSFKGLMGKTDSDFRVDSQGMRNEWSDTDYHPFLDESQYEIDKTVRKNSSCNVDGDTIKSRSLDVKEKLPFTKREYERFQRGELDKSLSATDRTLGYMIKTTLKDLHIR